MLDIIALSLCVIVCFHVRQEEKLRIHERIQALWLLPQADWITD